MPRSRATGASSRSLAKKHSPAMSETSRRVAKRARLLIEQMLGAMQIGLCDEAYRESDVWDSLFGAKQSMVANLQKLIAALVALPDEEAVSVAEAEKLQPLSDAELALLKAWLEEKEAKQETAAD